MKKNVISKLIFIILIIVLIVSIIIAIVIGKRNGKRNLTIEMYNEICNLENYSFNMKMENSEVDYSIIISKKGSSFSIDATSNDEHTTTLMEQENAYYVMHNKKEYYEYDNNGIEADILKDELEGIDTKEYTQGFEKINCKNYYYEEYTGITAFVMLSNYDQDESTIKTRFYFDGKNIAYIKTTIEDEIELLKVDFNENVDESLFEIPRDYAEL